MHVDEIRDVSGHGLHFFNTEKCVIYERNTDLFSGLTPSEWLSCFSLLVVS